MSKKISRRAVAVAGAILSGAGASAQAPTECREIQTALNERKALVTALKAASALKNRMAPGEACALFGTLQRNGIATLAWIEANGVWCAIPDAFAEGFKVDQAATEAIGRRVCGLVRPMPMKIDPLPAPSDG